MKVTRDTGLMTLDTWSTSTDPFLAARWARVLPSLVVELTRLGRISRNCFTTSVWSF